MTDFPYASHRRAWKELFEKRLGPLLSSVPLHRETELAVGGTSRNQGTFQSKVALGAPAPPPVAREILGPDLSLKLAQ